MRFVYNTIFLLCLPFILLGEWAVERIEKGHL